MAIVLKTISDSREAQADLAKLRKSVDGIQSSTERVSSNLGKFAKIFAVGVTAFAGVKAITDMSDKVTILNNKLRVSTKSQEEFNFALTKVRSIAMENRTQLFAVGTLYSKLSRSTQAFGATQDEVAKVTDAVTKSLRLSGATATEASSAVLQFGQAMSSQLLAGDELRSLRENAPVLLEAIARGLKVDVGMLKQMGEKGLLPSIKVFRALLAEYKSLESQTGQLKVTYAEAFTNIRNSLSILWAETKESFTNMGDLFARTLNNIALSIAGFAQNLDIRLLAWKSKFYLFAYSVKEFFSTLFLQIRGLLGPFDAQIVKIKNTLNKLFSVKANVAIDVPTIDPSGPFANLDDAVVLAKDFAKKAEEPFEDLYEAVIGNSWIPDMVKGVETVLGYLLRKPLMIINDFVNAGNASFSRMSFFAPLALGLVLLVKYKSMMLRLVGIAALFAATMAGVKWFKTRKARKEEFSVVKEQNLDYSPFGKDAFTGKNPFLGMNNPIVETEKKLSSDFSVPLYQSSEKGNDLLEKNNKILSEKMQENLKALKDRTQIAPAKQKLKDRVLAGSEGFKVEWQRFKDSFNDSKFGSKFNYSGTGRTIKQVLGIPDRFPGTIMNQKIDVTGEVGRGPQRHLENRVFGHDIINALPRKLQTPFVIGFSAMLALAIVKAFKSGPVRTSLLGLLLAGFTVVSSKSIEKATYREGIFGPLNKSSQFVNDKFLKPIFGTKTIPDETDRYGSKFKDVSKSILFFLSDFSKGLKEMVRGNNFGAGSGSILNNTKDFLSFLAKMMLLFKGGREALGNVGKGILTAPANAAMQANNSIHLAVMNRRLFGDEERLSTAQRIAFGVADADEKTYSKEQLQAARDLSQQRNRSLPPDVVNANISRAVNMKRNFEIQSGVRDKIKGQIIETKAAMRQNTLNAFGGAGGLIGGVVGYQLGAKIAKGMEDSPAWQKIGVQIGGAMLGQSVGSAIGLAAGTVFLALLKIGLPIIAGIAAFTGGMLVGSLIIDAFKTSKDWLEGVRSGEIPKEEAKGDIDRATKSLSKAPIFGSIAPILNAVAKGGVNILGKSEEDEKIGMPISDFLKQGTNQIKEDLKSTMEKISESEIAKKISPMSPISAAVADTVPGPMPKLESLSGPTQDPLGLRDQMREQQTKAEAIVINSTKPEEISKPIEDKLVDSIDVTKMGFGELFNKLVEIAANTETNTKEKVEAVGAVTKEFFKSQLPPGIFEGFESPFSPPTSEGGNEDPNANKSFSDRFEMADDATFAKYQGDLIKQIEVAGIKNFKPEELEKLGSEFQIQALTIMENIDKLFAKKTAGADVRAVELEEELNQILKERLTTLQMEGKISKDVDTGEGGLNFGDAFELIKNNLPEIELSFESFKDANKKVRDELVKMAIELNAANIKINEAGYSAEVLTKAIADQNAAVESSITRAMELLQGNRPGYEQFTAKAMMAQTDFSQPAYNVLTETEEKTITNIFDQLKEQYKLQKDDATKEQAQVKITELTRALEKIKLTAERRATSTNVELLQSRFEDFGLSLEKMTYYSMDFSQREGMADKLDTLQKNKDVMETSDDPTITAEAAKANAKLLEGMRKELDKASPFYKDVGEMLGQAFSDSIKEGFSSSIKDLLKGKATFSETMNAIGQRFLDSVIDTFVEGMTERLFGDETFMDKMLDQLGTGIGSLFEKGGLIDKILTDIGILKPAKVPEQLTDFGEIYTAQKTPFDVPVGNLDKNFETIPFEPDYSMGTKFEKPFSSFVSPEYSLGTAFEPSTPYVPFADKKLDKPFATSLTPESAEGLTAGVDNSAIMQPVVDKLEVQNRLAEDNTKTAREGFDHTSAMVGAGTVIAGLAMTQSDSSFGRMIGILTMVLGAVQLAAATGAFASGGLIKGPGTGTSDSILARVSNREFVVNAKATKENLGLLTAINAGENIKEFAKGGFIAINESLPKFAKGGLVTFTADIPSFADGGVITGTPMLGNITPQAPTTTVQQTINLSVTGDISRQSRAEIMRLLPSIADGVNLHNREKGYRYT